MTDSPGTVTILHFDDEVSTVLSIPNSLYHHFDTWHPDWVDQDSVKFGRYYESFALQLNGRRVAVRYELTDDYDHCHATLDRLQPQSDIAIFDLTRMKPDGGIEVAGRLLYTHAVNRGMRPERVFILTGYPNLFEDRQVGVNIPAAQKILKPVDPPWIATTLAKLLLPLVAPTPGAGGGP